MMAMLMKYLQLFSKAPARNSSKHSQIRNRQMSSFLRQPHLALSGKTFRSIPKKLNFNKMCLEDIIKMATKKFSICQDVRKV